MHQLYVQDDWRIRRGLTLSIGLRYSHESPASTQYGTKSEFSPTTVDSLTGLMGGITHPTGNIYGAGNHFHAAFGSRLPEFPAQVSCSAVLSASSRQDMVQQLPQDEYTATSAVQQPSGNPFPAFYISQGPGPISYNINQSTQTAQFVAVGGNYSSRNITYVDPALRNPYSMTWSGGVQYEFKTDYLAEVVYQGSSGVGLINTSGININVLPQSIYSSTDTTLLNAVFANTQASLHYPQFGSISEFSNFGHSSFHSMISRVQHRFSSHFSANFMFTYSKALSGSAATGWEYYDWRLTKAVAGFDQKLQFSNQFSYELPFGTGRRFLDQRGVVDKIFGGWTFLTIQSIRSGLPVNFSLSGSPNRYLPGEGNVPSVYPGVAINVPNYSIGPNMWPQQSQNPFYNINAFYNPAAFTPGNAGNGIARTGWMWWPQYSVTKTWSIKERFKVTVRMDANNLLPEARWLNTANTAVNFASPTLFGRFPATTGYSFSNFYGQNGTFQGVLRLAF